MAPTSADYQRLVESVSDYAIFLLDVRGHVASWNRGAQRIKGYRADEIVGRHFSVFYPPEDIAAGKPARALVDAADQGRIEDEGWRLRSDGTRFWASVVITALRDETGELVGFGKVTRDLSERRAFEEQLRRSEERFRLLVESVADYAIYMLDPEGRVTTWNRGAQRMKGYAAPEIIGKSFEVFFPEADREQGRPQLELEAARQRGDSKKRDGASGRTARGSGRTWWSRRSATRAGGTSGSPR